ncbi:unnamed protein product [Caenorhabditis bovis]|uniref:Seven TM Receptor n=1 Tax=Caenorhabditis bovis TaxID=2654633 RepID=A0A8S1E9R0_9PELO|nr:unnamed protein product [Caenorhabditis bovis]
MNWNKLRNNWQQICGIFSIFSNFYLLLLIKYCSPKQLGNYKYLMAYISVFEIFYSLVDCIAEPVIFSFRSSYIVFVDLHKISWFRRAIKIILHKVYCGFFGLSMAIFGVHFLYRYLITKGKKVSLTTIGVWLTIPIFYFFVWMSIVVVLLGPFDYFSQQLRQPVFQNFHISIRNIEYMGPYFYPIDFNGNQFFNYNTIYGIAILTLIIASSMLSVFYFGHKCYLHIQKFTKNANSIMIPCVLMYIPALVLFTTCFLDQNLEMASNFINISIAMYPAIDPLPTIFVVRRYRSATIGWNSNKKY